MTYLKRVFQLDEQWCHVRLPDHPNGYCVMILGDLNHFVNESRSLWEESEQRRHLVETLLDNGYTVFYSHLYGAHWGNDDSIKLSEDLIHHVLSKGILNERIHLLAEGIGALTALGLMERNGRKIRSAAFVNPCLDLKAYVNEAAETRWSYKKLIKQLADAYQLPVESIHEVIEDKHDITALNAKVPVKIWHSTSSHVYPFKVHSRVYAAYRKKQGAPVSLLLHYPEKRFYFNEPLVAFFHNHEAEL
ncbi:MAG TPA: hypothetical protein VFK44_15145 [Bacillales bacterium]|nr:hypothetical protein [Bacillales bacterium]